MCTSRTPSVPGRSLPAIPCGKANGEPVRFRAAVATAWARAPDDVRCSSRWVGPSAVRGDRRRSGGNADHTDRRSLRGLSEAVGRRPAVIGGRREGTRRLADRRDLQTPNRERCRSGVCRGIDGGRSTPRQPPQGTHGVWPHGVCWLDALSPRQASRGAPPKHRSGRRPEQSRPGPRIQAPQPLGRQPRGPRGRLEGSLPRADFDPTLTLRGPAIVDLGRSCGP